MKTVVLTGATSMIGVALIKQCIKYNVKVAAFVRPESSKLCRIPKSDLVTIIDCDLGELSNFGRFSDVPLENGVFYHLGWKDNEKQYRDSCYTHLGNIQYTLDAVHLASKMGCKRFIGLGGQDEYGHVSCPMHSMTPVNPVTPTGIAKYAAGKFSNLECEKLDLGHIWVRLLSAYGVNDHEDRLIKTFIKNCGTNTPMDLSPCTHIWDYLYEDDAGRALFMIGEKGVDGRVYVLGGGMGKPLKEYLEIIKKLVNPDYVPCYGKIPYNEKSPGYLCADISELIEDTGWKPEISFEDGIKNIVQQSDVCMN
jgi:nucleoside-diphosphate-sugar epimerase